MLKKSSFGPQETFVSIQTGNEVYGGTQRCGKWQTRQHQHTGLTLPTGPL